MEACTDKSKVGRLLRRMHGCRDAGVSWEFASCQVMIGIGFVQGSASPCIYRHLERQHRVWLHGDDLVPLGHIISVNYFLRNYRSFGLSRIEEILGPSGHHDCVQSIRVLGRIVDWTADGITWEADPRHAELFRKSFGVTGRSVATPGVRDKTDDIEGEVPISKEAADRYRAKTMRTQYLSHDRPGMEVEYRDLARKMQQPSNLDEMRLKKVSSFSRSASEAGLVVQVATAGHTH